MPSYILIQVTISLFGAIAAQELPLFVAGTKVVSRNRESRTLAATDTEVCVARKATIGTIVSTTFCNTAAAADCDGTGVVVSNYNANYQF